MFEGKPTEATLVEFITRKEDFNEYQLANGKIIKIKLVVTQIIKLDTEKDINGNPIYSVASTNVMAPVE